MLLRPRQKLFVERSVYALDEHQNTHAVAPTGAGKTIMLSAVVGEKLRGSAAKAVVLAHRDELTDQNRNKFHRVAPGISTSVVDASEKSWAGQATFAMVPTLTRGANLDAMPALDLLVIDEAHHAVADSYRRIIDRALHLNPMCRIYGVTATPNRGDRKGLRPIFSNVADQILCHHTKKVAKKALTEDPFMALSGASALRSFYTSGMIMYRPEEDRPERRLEIELRNGPALDALLIDKRGGRWVEVNANEERLVRQTVGVRLDAERVRKHDIIMQLIFDEASKGRLYNIKLFGEKFENKAGLGGADTTMTFRPSRFEGGGMRYLRFRAWLTEVSRLARGIDRVVFEEVRAHAGTDAAHIYGGFLAHLTAWCEERELPYQGVPVGTIKRFATGKGNAGKDAMVAAIKARGFHPTDDNEADALAILLWAIDTQGGAA